MEPTTQFLFATMDGALLERNARAVEHAQDCLIINQVQPHHRNPAPAASADSPEPVQNLTFQERGLSRSRNRALDHATADLCYLCDDDVELAEDAPDRVRQAFARHPKADLLIFSRATALDVPTPPGRFAHLLPISLRLMGVSSIQIAFRRESLTRTGIRFDERFGLGAEFPTSEEAVFLHDCWRAGLRIEWTDEIVAAHPLESSGRLYSDSRLAVAKGAMLSRLFRRGRHLFALAFAVKSYALYRHHYNLLGFFAALEEGASQYAMAPQAGRDRGLVAGAAFYGDAQSADAESVFEALNAEEIRYCAWKDLHELADFKRGNAEVDLFVHADDLMRFRKTCSAHGFAEFRNRTDLYQGTMFHFIRFAHGRHFHLHVQTALFTGDHAAKEFDLSGFADERIFRGPVEAGIRRVDPQTEFNLGILRLMMKARDPRGIRLEELERLRQSYSPDTFKTGIEDLSRYIILSDSAQETVREVLTGKDEALIALPSFESELDALRRIRPLHARVNRLRSRFAVAASHLGSLSNKVIPKRAPVLAFIGVDGSGKTTLCDALTEMTRRKISVKRIYLGSNDSTYSLPSKVAYVLHGALRKLEQSMPDARIIGEITRCSEALLEYSKCRDRVSAIRAGHRFSRRGVLVLFERYPIKRLFDYPPLAGRIERGEVQLSGWFGERTRKILRQIDPLLESVPAPDEIILLRTDYSKITDRRALGHFEEADIRSKLELLDAFDPSTLPNLHEIQNTGSPADALDAATLRLTSILCSRNS